MSHFEEMYRAIAWQALAKGDKAPPIALIWAVNKKSHADMMRISLTQADKELGKCPIEKMDLPIHTKMVKKASGVFVELRAVKNTDFDAHSQMHKAVKKHYWLAKNQADAEKTVRLFIGTFQLGGGNFPNADVYDAKTLKKLGYFSYNGRFWPV